MPLPNASPSSSAPLSARSAGVLSSLLEERTGQQISADRSWRIDTALKPLLRDRDLTNLDQLVKLLLDGREPLLGDAICDALVNQETSFFREAPVFDMVVEAVAAAEADGRRARIWSAGCANGQEPLSLAMLFAERQETTGLPAPEIVASDVSGTTIARCKTGQFNQFEIQRGLPIRRAMRWFDGTPSGEWTAKPDLLRMIYFRRLNLVSPDWAIGRFDVVLCRNVLMYLTAATKPGVFERLALALKPEGSLVLGAGETVIGQTRLFEPSKRYRGFYEAAPGAATSGMGVGTVREG
jgi:chemotaxis protein methyltransferase CheR